MKKITLDADALANLRSVAEHVEVCDSEGRIVGYFQPTGSFVMLIAITVTIFRLKKPAF